MTLRLNDIDRLLTTAEQQIALLWRCGPTNLTSEMARVERAWRRGVRASPAFVYLPARDFSALHAALEEAVEHAAEVGAWGSLYAERARELDREAAAAEAIGTAAFLGRACERFALEPGEDAAQAARWAKSWAELGETDEPEARHQSDDLRDPDSLVRALQTAIGACRLGWRVEVREELESAALTADHVVVVRAGLVHTDGDVRRIVVHELFGHVLPRAHAEREALGLFRVGSAGSSEDEEGRALWLERRAGCLDGSRRAELGRRHMAACAVREGAEWPELVELLLSTGASLGAALRIAARVARGGGLGREVVYLPALSRVEQALERDPGLERWMRRGRISIFAAERLRELCEPLLEQAAGRAA